MKKIEAIVRPEKMEDVKEALNNIEVHGITMYQVMGCGTQHGMTEVVRGQHPFNGKNQIRNRRFYRRMGGKSHQRHY